MSDHEQFSVGSRPRVMTQAGAADITVTVADGDTVEVLFPQGGGDQYRLQQRGDRITIRPLDKRGMRASISIELVVPAQTDLKLTSASGDIEVLGDAGDVEIGVASGDVHVDGAHGALRVKSVSGDVELGDSRSDVDVTTVSGDVRLGETRGSVSVSTASGDIRLAAVDDICSINTVSGDVSVRRCDASDLSLRTMSGDMSIGLPPRRRIDLDYESLAGDFRNDLQRGSGDTPDRTISLRCRSVSGDLTLRSSE